MKIFVAGGAGGLLAARAAIDAARKLDELSIGPEAWLPMFMPSLAALLYPLALEGFHASITRSLDGDVATRALSGFSAAMCLALAFAVPLIATLAAVSLSEIGRPTAAQLRAKRAALLAVAAPTLFVFLGVVLDMLQNAVPDMLPWVAGWAIAIAVLLRSDNSAPARVAARPVPGPLRVAHGVSALALVTIFLALHISNHLLFAAGGETWTAVQAAFRHVYRSDVLQPVLVALFLFQVGTGLFFVHRLTTAPTDRFRTFQIAAGVYLAVYVLCHMNTVFIYARTMLGINTGWSWITSAPTGIVMDAWNIRLLPHYWLGIFFVLAHLGAGARLVMLAHGVRKVFADRFMVSSAVVAAIIATWIMLGMSGMRVHFV